MSRPIKISDQLYQRLKSQANSQGLTLQDALIELITTPHEGLNALQSQLEASSKVVAWQRDSQLAQQGELQKFRNEVASLRQRINELSKLREKDVEAFNGWTDTWKLVHSLSARVSNLERLSHRHIWQEIEEDE